MKLVIPLAALVALLASPGNSPGFSLWKTCFDITDSTKKKLEKVMFHQIVDADVVKIWNKKYYTLAIVKCFAGRGRHAFSRFSDGEPLFADSSVRIPNKSGKICEGDVLYVHEEECHIISLTKKKRKGED